MFGKMAVWFFTGCATIAVLSLGAPPLFQRAVLEQESKAAPLSHELEGKVVQVDPSSSRLRMLVETPEGDLFALFLPPQEVVVMQWGKVTELGQLEAGQHVKVRYKSREGRAAAHLVEIADPQPMPAAADKPSTPWKDPVPTPAISG